MQRGLPIPRDLRLHTDNQSRSCVHNFDLDCIAIEDMNLEKSHTVDSDIHKQPSSIQFQAYLSIMLARDHMVTSIWCGGNWCNGSSKLNQNLKSPAALVKAYIEVINVVRIDAVLKDGF